MSSAAVVISSALRFIFKQTMFRNIFLIFRRKWVLTLHANLLQLGAICMQFQIILSGKNKKYNKLSAVELAMGKLIQLCLVGMGEFLVCMQFNQGSILALANLLNAG